MTNNKEQKKIPQGTLPFYAVCALGGCLSAGGTHLMITPLDLVKCRIQTNKSKYTGILQAMRVTLKEDGSKGLVRGWAPTAIGYGLQGISKFGCYELFKYQFAASMDQETFKRHRTWIYLVSASLAEGIGDVLLAPFEAAKVRTQTQPGAPREMRKCLPLIYKEAGLGGLYKGLPALWMRQIPYTASKFLCFEFCIEKMYWMLKMKQSECSLKQQMGVTFAAGCIAGVVCAVVSHPPDVMVSLMYKNNNMTFGQAFATTGFKGLWSGLSARMLMIASIAAAQLFIVDSTKRAFNLEYK